MPKIQTLPTVTNTPTSSQFNDAMSKITTAFSNTLSRDGSTPNTLSSDLDLNGNDVINVTDLSISGTISVNGATLQTSISGSFDFATRAEFVTWNTDSNKNVGMVVNAEGLSYRYVGTATSISDLLGWIPNGDTYPEHFGDIDGIADEVQINLAQIYNNSNGFGPVYLQAKTYIISAPVIIRNKSGYIGKGHTATCIKVASGATTGVMETLNFSTQTGTDLWFTSDGVLHGFYVKGIRFDGNKSNAVSSFGIRIYGKRYTVEEIMIHDVDGDCFLSEAGISGGQTDYTDMPEASITRVWIKNGGANGFVYRGPHDGWVDEIYVASCSAGTGAIFWSDSLTYNGACDVGMIHTYSNNKGCEVNVRLNGSYIQVESNLSEGLVSTSGFLYVDTIRAFKNWSQYSASEAPAGSASISLQGKSQIGKVYSRTDYGGTALSITGTGTSINHAQLDGVNKNGVGVDIDANQIFLNADIFDFNGGTGTGVKSCNTAGRSGHFVRVTTRTCDTHWNQVNTSSASSYEADMFTVSGDIGYTGATPTSTMSMRIIERGNATKNSDASGTATITAGNTFVDVTHGVPWTPSVSKIRIVPNGALTGLDAPYINNIGATTFRINISGTLGSNVTFGWSVSP